METQTAIDAYTSITFPLMSLGETVLILLVLLPSAPVLGYFAGARQRRVTHERKGTVDKILGETTLGAILALFGLLLAFSFGHALNNANIVKTTLIDEAAALGTAFSRADYLPEPARTDLQQALYDYAKTRLFEPEDSSSNLDGFKGLLENSLIAQSKLWPLTVEVTADPFPAPLKTFIAGSVNSVLDAHLDRTQTLSTPVSEVAQAMVLAMALTALFLVGNRAGLMGRSLTWRTFVFSGFVLLIMMTILDIQRSVEGLILVDDTALRATILEMELVLAGRT